MLHRFPAHVKIFNSFDPMLRHMWMMGIKAIATKKCDITVVKKILWDHSHMYFTSERQFDRMLTFDAHRLNFAMYINLDEFLLEVKRFSKESKS